MSPFEFDTVDAIHDMSTPQALHHQNEIARSMYFYYCKSASRLKHATPKHTLRFDISMQTLYHTRLGLLFFFLFFSARMKNWVSCNYTRREIVLYSVYILFTDSDFITSYYNYNKGFKLFSVTIGILLIESSSLLQGSHRSIHLEDSTPFCQPDQTRG